MRVAAQAFYLEVSVTAFSVVADRGRLRRGTPETRACGRSTPRTLGGRHSFEPSLHARNGAGDQSLPLGSDEGQTTVGWSISHRISRAHDRLTSREKSVRLRP
jgi:hypothetical protein